MSSTFDPSEAISSDFGIFGIPSTEKTSRLVLLPVPWEVTTSYGNGASLGPELIRQASEQVDLFDIETKKAYEAGYYMREIPKKLKNSNSQNKKLAQQIIKMKTARSPNQKKIKELQQKVNKACNEMVAWVEEQTEEILKSKKLFGLIGGDHSTPLGAIQAFSKKYKGDFAVLHFDAHADLRKAYQGFTHSHASIMYNVMTGTHRPKKLVQVGIRDFCEEEFDFIESRNDIRTFFDLDLKRRAMNGESWSQIANDIVKELPEKIYISFDIDGLDPAYCPHTGTPVPGGLQIEQVFYIFRLIAETGRKIIGFDLNEVSTGGVPLSKSDEWDGNVGARILYKLCGWSVLTNP